MFHSEIDMISDCFVLFLWVITKFLTFRFDNLLITAVYHSLSMVGKLGEAVDYQWTELQ